VIFAGPRSHIFWSISDANMEMMSNVNRKMPKKNNSEKRSKGTKRATVGDSTVEEPVNTDATVDNVVVEIQELDTSTSDLVDDFTYNENKEVSFTKKNFKRAFSVIEALKSKCELIESQQAELIAQLAERDDELTAAKRRKSAQSAERLVLKGTPTKGLYTPVIGKSKPLIFGGNEDASATSDEEYLTPDASDTLVRDDMRDDTIPSLDTLFDKIRAVEKPLGPSDVKEIRKWEMPDLVKGNNLSLRGWVSRAYSKRRGYANTPVSLWISHISAKLSSEYSNFVDSYNVEFGIDASYETFLHRLWNQFYDVNEIQRELNNLETVHQGDKQSVREYCDAVRNIAVRAEVVDTLQVGRHFWKGLRTSIKSAVKTSMPSVGYTFEKAVRAAEEAERQILLNRTVDHHYRSSKKDKPASYVAAVNRNI